MADTNFSVNATHNGTNFSKVTITGSAEIFKNQDLKEKLKANLPRGITTNMITVTQENVVLGGGGKGNHRKSKSYHKSKPKSKSSSKRNKKYHK